MRGRRNLREREGEKQRERERERKSRARSDIPARLTHLVPARVLPARRFKISSPAPRTTASARARAYRHAQRYTRWSPYPRSISFLLTREKTTTLIHHLLSSSSHTLPHRLVSPRCTGERYVLVYLIGIREVCSGLVGK